MPCVSAIDRDMDDGSHMMARLPFYAKMIHHLRVAHADDLPSDIGTDTMPGNFLNIGNLAAIGSLVGKSIAQSSANGMGGEMLDMSSQMQQFVFVKLIGMHSFYGKLTMSERSGLVKNNSTNIGQCVHKIAAFHENTLTRSATQSTEERERYTDDQRARARHHQEYESTMKPCGEGFDIACLRE